MRTPLSKTVRFEVFKRDGFKCQYCGAQPPDVTLEADHVIPLAEGGPNDMDNLITSCFACNRGKGARSLSSIPQSLEDKAAEIAEREEQVLALTQMIKASHDLLEERMWEIAEILHPGASDGYQRSKCTSIRRFIEQLGFPETFDAARIAESRFASGTAACFRYFCGVCWRKIKEARGEE